MLQSKNNWIKHIKSVKSDKIHYQLNLTIHWPRTFFFDIRWDYFGGILMFLCRTITFIPFALVFLRYCWNAFFVSSNQYTMIWIRLLRSRWIDISEKPHLPWYLGYQILIKQLWIHEPRFLIVYELLKMWYLLTVC